MYSLYCHYREKSTISFLFQSSSISYWSSRIAYRYRLLIDRFFPRLVYVCVWFVYCSSFKHPRVRNYLVRPCLRGNYGLKHSFISWGYRGRLSLLVIMIYCPKKYWLLTLLKNRRLTFWRGLGWIHQWNPSCCIECFKKTAMTFVRGWPLLVSRSGPLAVVAYMRPLHLLNLDRDRYNLKNVTHWPGVRIDTQFAF